MKKYTFDSTGGCARCDNMDGEYGDDEKPSSPHEICDCQIYGIEIEDECCRLKIDPPGAFTSLDPGFDPSLVDIEVEWEVNAICLADNKEFTDHFLLEKLVLALSPIHHLVKV